MSALYDNGKYEKVDLFIPTRPLPDGRMVRYKNINGEERSGRVKDAGFQMLWVVDLEDRDVHTFLSYSDLTAVLESLQAPEDYRD
jgi:hypothetical protein